MQARVLPPRGPGAQRSTAAAGDSFGASAAPQGSWMLDSRGNIGLRDLRPDEHTPSGFNSNALDTGGMLDSFATAQHADGAPPPLSLPTSRSQSRSPCTGAVHEKCDAARST